ncbi:MAG: lysylphosphatidylglycerol synthase domain-containing protein, partial [Acidobacteriia bacterium]|nr:lysylphosphatidylglycerol synthase domain-containing protein [Terriglobia bacterium]
HEAGLIMFAATALMIVALVAFRLRAEQTTRWLVARCGFLSDNLRRHLEHFLRSFADGLKVIQNWRDLVASLVITLVLWVVNCTVFWSVFRSLGGELRRLSWLSAAMTMFFAVLGLVVQLPGIGGGYLVFTALALTELFSVGAEAATGAAVMTWIMISVPCLALGVILLLHEGLTFRKLEAIAEEERAAAEEEV